MAIDSNRHNGRSVLDLHLVPTRRPIPQISSRFATKWKIKAILPAYNGSQCRQARLNYPGEAAASGGDERKGSAIFRDFYMPYSYRLWTHLCLRGHVSLL
jgi:hypothetical protein